MRSARPFRSRSRGSNLAGAVLIITGSGVAVTGTRDARRRDAHGDAHDRPGAPTSASEARLLIVTTESGQTTIEFFVVPANVPSVTVVTPGAGEPGQTVPVTLRGLNLTGGVVSEGTADLVAPERGGRRRRDDHRRGRRRRLPRRSTPTTRSPSRPGAGISDVTFRVIAAGSSFFNAARPPFGNRGTIVTVRLDGVNLGTVVPGTGIQLSGPKITRIERAGPRSVDGAGARSTSMRRRPSATATSRSRPARAPSLARQPSG